MRFLQLDEVAAVHSTDKSR